MLKSQGLVCRKRLSSVVMAAAAEGGCEVLLEWLVEQYQGCVAVLPRESPLLYVPPAVAGDSTTLTVLRRIGVPWGAQDVVLCTGCGGEHGSQHSNGFVIAAVHWLVEQVAPVGSHRDLQEVCEVSGPNAEHVRQRHWGHLDARAGRAGSGRSALRLPLPHRFAMLLLARPSSVRACPADQARQGFVSVGDACW